MGNEKEGVYSRVLHEGDTAKLSYNEAGLIPAIIQEYDSGLVLMMAWMNQDSLQQTFDTGETVFWSRSRQEIWHKGATSGNTQEVKEILIDCDLDTLLIRVKSAGPACHKNTTTCFDNV